MPFDDKLTTKQRVRLESLSQATMTVRMTSADPPTLESILAEAEKIETWMWKVENNIQ